MVKTKAKAIGARLKGKGMVTVERNQDFPMTGETV
jgi:hypothetical protein